MQKSRKQGGTALLQWGLIGFYNKQSNSFNLQMFGLPTNHFLDRFTCDKG